MLCYVNYCVILNTIQYNVSIQIVPITFSLEIIKTFFYFFQL